MVLAMDSIFAKKESLLLELEFFSSIYSKNKPVSPKELGQYPDASLEEYHLLFNHVVGNALVEFGKLEGNRIADLDSSKIKSVERQEVNKLAEVKATIDNLKNPDQKEHK